MWFVGWVRNRDEGRQEEGGLVASGVEAVWDCGEGKDSGHGGREEGYHWCGGRKCGIVG